MSRHFWLAVTIPLAFFAGVLWSEEPKRSPSYRLAPGEVEGKAEIVSKARVLKNRGKDGQSLWPLRHTEHMRMNYYEVTRRTALHFHPDADHILYVLEGPVLVTCGAETTECEVGDLIVVPQGVRHCYDVPKMGDSALLLTCDAPAYDHAKTVVLE